MAKADPEIIPDINKPDRSLTLRFPLVTTVPENSF
jgi:hypothetical protein